MTAYGVFGTTLDAVYALAPEADRVVDPSTSKLPTPITETTVAGWIVDLDAAVSVALGRWSELVGHTAARIAAAARAAIACGAASYLEAARYPTRAGLNDSSYAGVLWARYTAGVTSAAALVTAAIKAGDDLGGDDDGLMPTAGPFGRFPPTYFPDAAIW